MSKKYLSILYIMNLCKYSNIFGLPNQGIHSYRLFNIAIIDVIATLFIGFIINKLTKIKLYIINIILFLLGIIMHKIFCVNTTINKLIFTS